jgi:hypothetical protein
MADNNNDVRVFTFNGQVYSSYQEMVNAKRQRNADVLAGLFEAKAAVDAATATTRLRRPTNQQHSNGKRRKSTRLAGDTAPKIYIDTESEEVEPPAELDGDANDDEEEEGVGVMWTLTKNYTVKELKKSEPIMCSTEDCNHVACSRWESDKGGMVWDTCLDCQEA